MVDEPKRTPTQTRNRLARTDHIRLCLDDIWGRTGQQTMSRVDTGIGVQVINLSQRDPRLASTAYPVFHRIKRSSVRDQFST